jgi:hypothetical protein
MKNTESIGWLYDYFSRPSEKENPWSEDETDTGTTTEANEPIEVDDDVSHEASKNKEQGKLFAPMLMHLLQYILSLSYEQNRICLFKDAHDRQYN